MSAITGCFMPRHAATGEEMKLAMQRLWLTGRVLPAGARLTVQHVFQSAEEAPLEVIYSFPLPRDAAMRAFRITGDGFESHSELRPVEEAVKEYERGIAAGSLSALARQYGDGVVNLTVGNIRPGETVTVYLEILAGVESRDDGFRFRFPFALAPTYHAQAKYAGPAPGEGEIELPTAEFGDVILPRFRRDASALHQVGFELNVSGPLELAELGSASHAVRVRGNRVSLAPEKDVPNRDLILDATYAKAEPQVLAGKGHFAALVPSISFGANPDTPRRVAILLDRSGSMGGTRLAQAVRGIEACLGALSERDRFGLVAFNDTAGAFRETLLPATRENRDGARAFLRGISADGGTELACGFQRAAQVLGPEGGDVMIFTDGEVCGTEAILAQAKSTGIRLHCLGIGDASQDRFLALLARETGGVSRYVSAHERVDLTAVDLFASIGRPVATGLKAAANVQPAPAAVIFSGTPVLLFGEGDGAIDLEWDGGGSLRLPIPPGDDGLGETVRLLQGSRLITDWESRYPASEAVAPLDKRRESRVAARLQELSRTYGLASREMSLVAVVKRAGDHPGELPETRVVAVGMPPGTDFEAYFGVRVGKQRSRMAAAAPQFDLATAMFPASYDLDLDEAPSLPAQARPGLVATVAGKLFGRQVPLIDQAPQAPGEDSLLEFAAQLDADGGMPDHDAAGRAARTTVALCAFLAQGHTASAGAFRSHVDRMVKFLAKLGGLEASRRRLVEAVLGFAARGVAPPGDWLAAARAPGGHWEAIERAVAQAAKAVKI